jgi:hypothetical protein
MYQGLQRISKSVEQDWVSDSPALSLRGKLDSLLAFEQEYADHSFY